MNGNSNLVKKIENILENTETLIYDHNTLDSYIDALKKFDEMVKSGVAKKRESNLLSIEKKMLFTYRTNLN